ncbi:hypothetical protein D1AOALGA4SA_5623 [Olavius algarvensis Delta 1 endosymbiont]|nr:hypothetical protein D1AOALGA4SA_5623 [Olavius algarvensis Delta 1 endosymbiont]
MAIFIIGIINFEYLYGPCRRLASQGAVIFSGAFIFLILFEDERLERCKFARENF